MKKILRSPVALLLLAVVLVGTGVVAYRQLGAIAPEQQYRLEGIAKGDLSQTVSANGTINPVSLVNVGTQVSGTVKKLYVDFNSKVEKGQVLLELDDALLAAQQKQSQANVLSAAASLDLASANEARMRNLYAQEYVSRQEFDTAVQAKKAADAQLKLARAAVEKDKANLSYSVIRSPVSGVVVDRAVDVGQTVAASLQTPTLFKIAQDLSEMQIDASFAEADVGGIRIGQTARFSVDAFPNRSFQGTVRQVRLNPTTLQNVVTYDVVIDVDNPEQILMPGMTAYVSIAVAERKDALLVPNAALRFKPANGEQPKKGAATNGVGPKPKDEKYLSGHPRDAFSGKVYVLKDGKLAPVGVSLGITDNRNTEILGGELKAGDQVVVGNAHAANSTPSSSSPPRMRMF
ncbi:RND transporter [Ferrigenium kumadai]|uniref:RND transporter n=1 Tax=Ferrigenium kumadai TaxID=1682490 RepID=A0AAN1VZQ7_9PROT|nr:efflux RND transporter periplasmic adaptor subunit [Ferrigenium kumadai]BBI99635.1 RND transporter [Ferrigenium kumadai]